MSIMADTNAIGRRGWRVLGMAAAIVALLLVPLIAMQFTAEVQWTASDFVAAAVLLGAAAIGCELALRSLRGTWRLLACAAVLAMVALIWAQGAVGIF